LSVKSCPRDASCWRAPCVTLADFTSASSSCLTASAKNSRALAPVTAVLPGVRPRMALATSLTASGSTRPCCRTWLVSSLTRSRIGWSTTAADAASVADVVGSGMSCSLAAAGHSVADFAQGRQRPPSFSSCATIRSSWAWSQASPGAQILWIAKPELLIDPGLAKLGKQHRYFAQIVGIGHSADQIGGTHKARIVAGAAMLFVLPGREIGCLLYSPQPPSYRRGSMRSCRIARARKASIGSRDRESTKRPSIHPAELRHHPCHRRRTGRCRHHGILPARNLYHGTAERLGHAAIRVA